MKDSDRSLNLGHPSRLEKGVLDDLTLAQRIASRDPQAMDLLAERHLRPLYRFLRQLTRRTEDAEDLAQQTLIRAIAGAARYDGRAPMKAWLYGIAFREFTKWRRRKPWLPLLASHPSSREPYNDIVEAETLLSALAKLPATSQGAFLLHYVEEMPLAEIALVLDVPEGTVKSRLHSARARMRELLTEEEIPYVPESC